MAIRIVGCYEFDANPWHLIEVEVSDLEQPLQLDDWVLAVPGEPRENWQVPHDEHFLTPQGWIRPTPDNGFRAPVARRLHLCFWLYRINNGLLLTQLGPVPIPSPTPLPERLRKLQFDEP